ncbi:MAG: amidohydrolase [Rikenellaceae bacterium]
MATLLTNATILPMTRTADQELTFVGAVGVVNNTIALVTSETSKIELFKEQHPECRTIDCQGNVVMPGLINTHCHVSMTILRGYADDMALMEWLNNHVWPFEAQMTPDQMKLGAELGIVEMLQGGTTSFVDMYWNEHRIAEAVAQLGIRAMLGCSIIDHKIDIAEQDVLSAIEATRDNPRAKVSVAPHAAYTCSPETLKLCVDLAQQHDLHFMSHIAETLDEEKIIRDRYNCTPVEHFQSLGALNQKMIAAHTIHLSESDINILKEHNVTIAHNPQSNMKLASGIAPIVEMHKAGVTCTIGTDGASSNNDLDMWEELRTCALLQKVDNFDPCALPAYEVLKMATVNAAAAMGQSGKLGIIEEGALADIIVVDMQKPHLQPIHNTVSNLVYSAKASDVMMTIVDGEILVEGGRVVNVDYKELFTRIKTATDSIIEQIANC